MTFLSTTPFTGSFWKKEGLWKSWRWSGGTDVCESFQKLSVHYFISSSQWPVRETSSSSLSRCSRDSGVSGDLPGTTGPKPTWLKTHPMALSSSCVCVDWDEEGGKNSRPNLRLGAELRCWQWPFNLQVTASFWSGKIPKKNKGRGLMWDRRTRIWNRRCKWKSFILPPLSQSLLPSLSFFSQSWARAQRSPELSGGLFKRC